MKKNSFVIIVFLLAIVLHSCDVIDAPYVVPGNSVQTQRKIILEDFTGHKCVNCPSASFIAHSLQELYGERLILISIHSGFFALPDQEGLYTADFRTELGNEITEFYEIQSNPSGLVDRMPHDGNLILPKDNWACAVNNTIAYVEEANVIINHSYNPATRMLDIQVNTEFLTEPQGSYNICLYITGDTIAPQKNNNSEIGPTPDWENYHHEGVLIQALDGGAWGIPINNGQQIIMNQIYTNDFSGTLKEGWPGNRCHLVAFISQVDTREILQAEQMDIVN